MNETAVSSCVLLVTVVYYFDSCLLLPVWIYFVHLPLPLAFIVSDLIELPSISLFFSLATTFLVSLFGGDAVDAVVRWHRVFCQQSGDDTTKEYRGDRTYGCGCSERYGGQLRTGNGAFLFLTLGWWWE